MSAVKFIASEALAFQATARDRDVESCAIGLVYPAYSNGNPPQYLVRGLVEVRADAYSSRSSVAAVLKPEFSTELSNLARASGAGILFAHTHVGATPLQSFSTEDDRGEILLAEYLQRRAPDVTHFSSVFTGKKIIVRQLGSGKKFAAVSIVGRDVAQDIDNDDADLTMFDRQVRALGISGQRRLASMKVIIVGAGGTGSVVAQQLAYLGIKNFLIIDPDFVDITNLNRLVGANPSDIGRSKVIVMARHIRTISPDANVEEILGDVTVSEIASSLSNADFIFGCTDSMASRAILNQIAYQYLVPYIDVGVGIYVRDGKVEYITGRTQMLSPGLPCLLCTDKIDFEQVRREMMSDEARQRDPYVVGAPTPQPAVISLNSTMSSAAITMFLSAVAGFPSSARMLTYDGIRGTLRPVEGKPRENCIVCSTAGALARGSSWDLPTRQEPR